MPRTPYLLASLALLGGLTAGGGAAGELRLGAGTPARSLHAPATADAPEQLPYADLDTTGAPGSDLSGALQGLRYVPVTTALTAPTIPATIPLTTPATVPTTVAPPPTTEPPTTQAPSTTEAPPTTQPEPTTTEGPTEPEPAPPAPVPAPVAAAPAEASFAPPPAVAGNIDSGAEWSFLALTNQARAAVGVGPLTMDASLQAYARYHAQEMAASGGIYHSDISQLLGPWSTVGENVGVGPSVGAIQNALLASPGHYRNLSDGGFGYVGVGVFVDASGRVWTAHVFAS